MHLAIPRLGNGAGLIMPENAPAMSSRRFFSPAPVEERAKVLLVDDRPDKLLALQAALAGLDEDLIIAHSGKEALRQLLVHDVAVILLDVNMPVMDGFETAALIRQRHNNEKTPIIFISALNPVENHVTRGYSLGAVDYIFSPVVSDVLQAKVAVFVDLYKRTREVKRRADWLRQEAELRAANLELRLDSLLNRLNVGVFRANRSGRLLSANPAYHRLFSINPSTTASSIDMNHFFVSEGDRLGLMARLLANGKIQEAYVQQRRMDGEVLWTSLSMAVSTDVDGTQSIDGMVEDITARKETEAALISKAEELARSNAELEQFAFIASHDLQEPLRMISSFASLMTSRYGGQLDTKGLSFLLQIELSAKRMQELVCSILSYSKTGKMVQRSPVDTADLVQRTLAGFEDALSEAAVEIDYTRLPVLDGDQVMLTQVFQNLIGNALKFRHPQRNPQIRIDAEQIEGAWLFTIADNGIGIPPEFHEKIFGIFQRLHTRDEYPGTGIGLAICKKVIERHGGVITIESHPDQGSTFRFTIPVPDPDARSSQT